MKKRLSSSGTLLWKIFSLLWGVGFAVGFMRILWEVLTVPNSAASIGKGLLALVISLALGIVGFYIFGFLKSVYLTEDSLLVSNYLKRVEIPLSSIEYVSRPDQSSHQFISIHLRTSSEFGNEIVFMPPLFMGHEIMEELRNRVGIDHDRPEDFATGKAQAMFLKRYRDIMKGKKD